MKTITLLIATALISQPSKLSDPLRSHNEAAVSSPSPPPPAFAPRPMAAALDPTALAEAIAERLFQRLSAQQMAAAQSTQTSLDRMADAVTRLAETVEAQPKRETVTPPAKVQAPTTPSAPSPPQGRYAARSDGGRWYYSDDPDDANYAAWYYSRREKGIPPGQGLPPGWTPPTKKSATLPRVTEASYTAAPVVTMPAMSYAPAPMMSYADVPSYGGGFSQPSPMMSGGFSGGGFGGGGGGLFGGMFGGGGGGCAGGGCR